MFQNRRVLLLATIAHTPHASQPIRGSQRQILPKLCRRSPLSTPARALVIMLMSLVQCLGPAAPAVAEQPARAETRKAAPSAPAAVTRVALQDLPIPVQEMRDAIQIAIHSGKIEDLRTAIDWNELPPEFGFSPDLDPIEQFRKLSGDGTGREFLAILANLLAEPPSQLPIGPDHENSGVYVWPYLSELPPQSLTPAQQVDLYRLMPAAEAAAVMKRDKWTWYRLAIGSDGTWHIFSK
ncbi:MAG: hypothetical protein KJ587_14495 [Alphaproteobacteria bacterium]|nr:hypothetical protein [Alphaproteobacteria bacterium]